MKAASIITAAGANHPSFARSGIVEPKNILKVGDRTVLQRAVDSYLLNPEWGVVAVLESELAFASTVEKLSLYPDVSFVTLPEGLPGALISALYAAGGLDGDCPLVIAAGDSEIIGGISSHFSYFQESQADAGTIVFEAKSQRWSYVDIDQNGSLNQVSEKQVIGPYATTGVFFFKSVQLFIEAAEWCLVNKITTDDLFYVSSTLNYLVAKGRTVSYSCIPRESYLSYSKYADFQTQES